MQLSETKSQAELSTFIESYWHFEGNGIDPMVLFPNGAFNIFFAPQQFVLQNDKSIHPAGVYVTPISSYPIRIFSQGEMYGIRFKAFSLNNVFSASISQLNLVNNMETIYAGKSALMHFRNLLYGLKDKHEIIEILKLASFELLEKNLHVNRQLRDQVNYILDKKGNTKILEMAKTFGVSRQSLHKYFKQHLLITPKELSSIWQLNHFLTLAEDAKYTLTSKALDAGYYDQSHFIRSFKTKYGTTPSSFVSSSHPTILFAKENMKKRFNNYYDPEL